jgi:hypothetical protein
MRKDTNPDSSKKPSSKSMASKVNLLIYQHLKTHVSDKLASKFRKATSIDLQEKLPDDSQSLAEIVRLHEESKCLNSKSESPSSIKHERNKKKTDSGSRKRKIDQDVEVSTDSKKSRSLEIDKELSRQDISKRPHGDTKCYNCNDYGHISRDCDRERKFVCYKCNEEGHKSHDCPKSVNTCFNCQEPGHMAKDCSMPKPSRFRSSSHNTKFQRSSFRIFTTGANSMPLGSKKED